MTHPLMLVIIGAKYEKNPMVLHGLNPCRTVDAIEQTDQDMPYFSSFIAKSWLNDIEDINQGQRSMHLRHTISC